MKKVIYLFMFCLLLVGCSSNTSGGGTEKVDVIIDVNQFSRISSLELVEIMGEPQKIEDYEWSVPKTGESIVGKLYIYEDSKYEFILFDDKVVKLDMYSGTFMGYDDSRYSFNSEKDIFAMFNIEPNNNMKKTADTNYALRYSPISETVADVWIQEISDNQFDIAKFTYNVNYF